MIIYLTITAIASVFILAACVAAGRAEVRRD